MKLSIDRCPVHGYMAICLDGREKGGGRRLTSGKCCGRWERLKAWRIDPRQLIEDISAEMAHEVLRLRAEVELAKTEANKS